MRPLGLLERFEGALDSLRGRPNQLERERQARAAYVGAIFSRLNSDWVVAPLQSDQELINDLKVLRTRTRDLGRNNAYAVGFMEKAGQNIIGPNGIGMRAQLPDGRGGQLVSMNTHLQDTWSAFTECVTADGRLALVDYCNLGVQTLTQDGELFTHKRVGRQYEFGLALEAIDADLFDEKFNVPRQDWSTGNEVRLAIEVDGDQRRVAYHAYRVPSVYSTPHGERRVLPAAAVNHLGRARRMNQTRFVPWFHPVMDALKMLDGVDEAELFASRLAASKMGWIETSENAGPVPGEVDRNGVRAAIPMEATPGAVTILPKGYKFAGWDPQHPTTALPAFRAAILRKISTGLGISYTGLANDPGDANYSSGRTAMQMEQRFWRTLQGFFVRSFMNDLFLEFLRVAPLTGQLSLGYGMTDPRAILRHIVWETPGWEWVDPKSDTEAKILAINANLDSPQRVAAERGLDFERDIVGPKKEAKRLLEEAGLSSASTDAPGGGDPTQADTPTDSTNDGSAPATKDAPPDAPTD